MDTATIKKLVASMEGVGVAFEKGLTDHQVKTIEDVGTFRFPPDLKAFLQYAVPITHTFVQSWDGSTVVDDRFPNWHNEPESILRHHQDRILGAFRFDVENSRFWMDEWGKRPEKLSEALNVVEQALKTVPRLIPLYRH